MTEKELASMLFRIREKHIEFYQIIINLIRTVLKIK